MFFSCSRCSGDADDDHRLVFMQFLMIPGSGYPLSGSRKGREDFAKIAKDISIYNSLWDLALLCILCEK
jgi:hypothetical protein